MFVRLMKRIINIFLDGEYNLKIYFLRSAFSLFWDLPVLSKFRSVSLPPQSPF